VPLTILNTGTFNGPPGTNATAGVARATGAALAGGGAPVLRTRRVGVALGNGSANSGGLGFPDLTRSQFGTVVSPAAAGAVHPFFGTTVPASLAAAPQSLASYAGVCRAWVDFELTHYGFSAGTYGAGGTPAAGAVTDAAALGTFITSCQAGGLDLGVVLWHEAYSKFNLGTQAQNNLDYANSMGYYGAVLRQHGLPVIFDPSNYSANSSYGHWAQTIGNAGAPGLGWAACSAGYIDAVYTDIYVNEAGSFGTQGTFDDVAVLASAFNLPLGIMELGVSPGTAPTPGYNEAQTDTFLSYTITWLAAWLANTTVTANGSSIPTTTVGDIVFWGTCDNGGYTQVMPQNWSAQVIADYKTLFSAYDSTTY